MALLVVASGCAANPSTVRSNYIAIQNRDANPVSVDVRVGDSQDCPANPTALKLAIAGKAVERVTVTSERWLCLRLTGTPAWRVEPLPGGKDYAFTIN